ncbi:MAG: FliM/FliN family flagellar motor switch protein [Hyphomonas sp.]|jgi:flagellar motor switch protein FliN/FliY|uniref:FliM/FliN family flagellar motor C-terminal domain-containing protein n=1 Tax=Hyphomonas sp. TaxID=87 RepID=UPI0018018A4A|nr:FliM/FliN family flagellar motor C-terminal domain-containing protein [Hyphomonas sp.]MBA3067865.1 FliM/FliN family flagellar motor switch protein [Hyphomonas sp.]MBU3919053.1 FliM/FliN family flagellar motor C-terminal domain-containing protein [Alphaproteobacteria bacterium]MBU4062421.1 FliM/FliN family flagellar motor C-terminal domain-containing protein [Alphaproteobacteria bacterium]MBU4165970.1 FliM/FliN family flagellar motor C-terminal domain-containing protein [Alphaproteobacteria b
MAIPEKATADTAADDRRDSSGRNAFRRSIYSVPVTVTVSIGQKRLSVSEILELQPESIVPLSSRIDDPVDLTIDNRLIARGELVETGDGQIAVKIIEIIERAPDENA